MTCPTHGTPKRKLIIHGEPKRVEQYCEECVQEIFEARMQRKAGAGQ